MEYVVTASDDGRRLRDVLRSGMRVSYTALKSAKWSGSIRVNGESSFVDRIVHTGDLVSFDLPVQSPVYTPKPCFRPLDIVYEDDHLMVIDKPAPLCSQSSAKQPDNTLENILYAHLGCPDGFIYRPVNRLDKGTSGLMVIARTAHAQQLLQKLLHSPDFERQYLAVTEGIPDPAEGVIDSPIAKEDSDSIRRIVTPDGKPSVTHYRVIEAAASRALVRLRLETGRTHQIRCHLASLGCPVCGDFLYGTELDTLPGRFALHSCSLRLKHPVTGELLSFDSPLPAALGRLLRE